MKNNLNYIIIYGHLINKLQINYINLLKNQHPYFEFDIQLNCNVTNIIIYKKAFNLNNNNISHSKILFDIINDELNILKFDVMNNTIKPEYFNRASLLKKYNEAII